MNRAQRHEAEKAERALQDLITQGLTREEAREQLAAQANFDRAVVYLHGKLFAEEYDYIYDSTSDLQDRRRGINPMNPEYSARIDAKRIALGIAPLGPTGLPTNDNSKAFCVGLVKAIAKTLYESRSELVALQVFRSG